MSESKNGALLRSFTSYCLENPELRFWQALLGWSGLDRISSVKYISLGRDGSIPSYTDTFHWEGRDG